jgi:uncharacterized protein (TIGR01777 family)
VPDAAAVPSTVAVTGASGFVGRSLLPALVARGHSVVALSREAREGAGARLRWAAYDPTSPESVRRAIEGADVVVHLAGESVFSGRWTAKRMERIRASRVDGTRVVVEAIASCGKKPRALVGASAIGFYGPRAPDETLDESSPPGDDFLAGVCRAWETEAAKVEALGVRRATPRVGVVLGRGGGALEQMSRPFRFFVGGPIGNGRQVVSWIHEADLIAMLVAMVEDDRWRGPANATAPNPVTAKELAKALGRALHRPSFLPAPAFALRIAIGKFASVLVTGQRVVPAAALARDFSFRFPTIDAALADLVGRARA